MVGENWNEVGDNSDPWRACCVRFLIKDSTWLMKCGVLMITDQFTVEDLRLEVDVGVHLPSLSQAPVRGQDGRAGGV